ncbi:PIN-like domain-containing protein [Terrisporobacter hibernicus]|uniref:PIN like domain-containing protein n=1 Tax=Terrisporobacter hibernicus TaxID=2813371 RepID=A0AAX2ZH53_9FIRM|nr:PIN-like domain-containing protein [Terrisporobacter hibernicus]UEL48115.1 hypothetical protein JW646_01305 [Terrisporobacter hibernicus]
MTYKNENDINNEEILIVFDTNALLELYSYPEMALEHIINKFNKYNRLFWIPKQVYTEFLRHNEENRKSQLQLVNELKGKINMDISHLKDQVTKFLNVNGKYKTDKFKDFKINFEKDLDYVKNNAKEQLRKIDEVHIKNNSCIREDNDIIDQFVKNIKSDIGFTQLELIDIYEEGEKRYKYNIAPGFTDKDKNNGLGVEKYNDLVIWKEILKKVEGTNCKLVFIQNEKKGDWWIGRSKNKPQDVLVEEFKSVTNKYAEFRMMHFKDFLNSFARSLGINGTSIKDINSIINLKQWATKNIRKNLAGLVECYIKQNHEEELLRSIEESLLGEFTLCGSIDEIKNIQIEILNVTDISLGEDSDEEKISYILNGNIDVITSGDATEYISREYSEQIAFNAKNELNIQLFFYIDINKALALKPEMLEDILEVGDIYIYINDIIDLDGQMIDSQDEEMDYTKENHIYEYNTCPDCGKKFSLYRDGGGGYCEDCAWKH